MTRPMRALRRLRAPDECLARRGLAAAAPDEDHEPLSFSARALKRTFDITFAAAALAMTWPVIASAILVARLSTRESGLFFQTRVGRHGRLFRVIKIRTMRSVPGLTTTVTCADDPRITRAGRAMRRLKIDELPQFWNVLVGDMAIVGPRPDIPRFVEKIAGADRVVLAVRPGITGPATLKYRNEEELLNNHADPEWLNREVLFPDKVRINREYVLGYTFSSDVKYLWLTAASMLEPVFAVVRRQPRIDRVATKRRVAPHDGD